MSQQLEFRISARDQASSVVTSVQKKVLDFGKDIGRSIGAALGPIALVTMAVQKIGEVMAENAAKRKEAFDWGADLSASAAALGVTVEQFQQLQEASSRTGQSVENIAKAWKLASDLIASAKAGNKEAIASLEALGIGLDELDKTKPEDVLGRLSGALATIEDPAKKGEAAIAALGKEAKNLQDVLEKGFDIAGAFQDTAGLSTEEAAELRRLQKEIQGEKNKQTLELARKQAADAFSARMLQEEADIAQGNKTGPSKDLIEFRRRVKEFQNQNGGRLPSMEEASAISGQMLREGITRPTPPPPKPEDKPRGKRLLELGEERNKPQDKPKDDKPKKEPEVKFKKPDVEAVAKTAAVTVSSLRAIGGGIAGEQVGQFDVQQMQLDVQKQMRDLLQDIKGNLKPPTDFSKPVIDGMTDYSGKSGVGVA